MPEGRKSSLIVRVKDAFTGRGPTLPFRCFVKEIPDIEGHIQDGTVAFFNLPSGKVTICFRSPYFRDKDVVVDPSVGSNIEVSLYPSELYPFPEGATLFKGGVVDRTEYPIGGAKVCLKWAGGRCETVTDDYGCFVLFPGPEEKKKWRKHQGGHISPGPKGRIKVQLIVSAPGYKTQELNFIWPAGKATCQEIELEPEKDPS